MRFNKKYIIISFVLIIALVLLINQLNQSPSKYTINVAGSTSVKPLMDLWANEYMKLYSNYKIDVAGGGSGKGIQQVSSGVIDIGMHSRPILENDPKFNAVTFTMANDGVLVVVNKQLPIIGLTKEAIQAIFGYSDKEVKYPLKTYAKVLSTGLEKDVEVIIKRMEDGRISIESIDGKQKFILQPYVRADSSGTAETFAVFLYGSWKAKWNGPSGKGVSGNQGMAQVVVSDPCGIGYLAGAYFNPKNMRAIRIVYWDGKSLKNWNSYETDEYGKPISEAIMSGAAGSAITRSQGEVYNGYPIARELYISINLDKFNGKIPKYIVEFLRWCILDGQRFVEKVGYVPLSQEQININLRKLADYSKG